jgi:hypothetical protein
MFLSSRLCALICRVCVKQLVRGRACFHVSHTPSRSYLLRHSLRLRALRCFSTPGQLATLCCCRCGFPANEASEEVTQECVRALGFVIFENGARLKTLAPLLELLLPKCRTGVDGSKFTEANSFLFCRHSRSLLVGQLCSVYASQGSRASAAVACVPRQFADQGGTVQDRATASGMTYGRERS